MDGPCGAIEVLRDTALLVPGSVAKGTVIVAHPHPLFGGTMDNKVVQTLARAFVQCGWHALRFNFRGVGRSAGTYDDGRGEVDDLCAVVRGGAPDGALAPAGFSFGAFVASQAAQQLRHERLLTQLVLVGPAVSRFPVAPLDPGLNPLVVHGELDETVPLSDVFLWARPQNQPVVVIPAASHFFHGQLGLLKSLVVRHLRSAD